MKEFKAQTHKLDDHVVADAIKAINLVKEEGKVEGHIGGGMAVGAYLPSDEQRPTIDLDFALLWGGTTEQFRQLVQPMVSELQAEGYDISIQKGDKTYDVAVASRVADESLLVQHQRRNRGNLERNRKSLEREVANQRIISRQGLSFAVMSPEDLMLHKLSRLFTFSEAYGLEIPRRESAVNMMKLIQFFQEELFKPGKELSAEDAARMRVHYDAYDIKHLAMHAGLNKGYFAEALKDWNTRYMNDEKARKLLSEMEIPLK
jgi:hypothetical protein